MGSDRRLIYAVDIGAALPAGLVGATLAPVIATWAGDCPGTAHEANWLTGPIAL